MDNSTKKPVTKISPTPSKRYLRRIVFKDYNRSRVNDAIKAAIKETNFEHRKRCQSVTPKQLQIIIDFLGGLPEGFTV